MVAVGVLLCCWLVGGLTVAMLTGVCWVDDRSTEVALARRPILTQGDHGSAIGQQIAPRS
jgi:hypothetical protein